MPRKNSKTTTSFLSLVHGGNKLACCRFFGVDPSKAIDFSANINPLGHPTGLEKHLSSRLSLIQNYPDLEGSDVRQVLSQYLGIPFESVLAGNGSMELIDLVLRMIGPKSVAIAQPTFSEYERISKNLGAEVHSFIHRSGDGFSFSLGTLAGEALRQIENSDVLILGNPNNPTGHLIQGKDLAELVEFSEKKRKWLLVDEAFIEFAGEEYSLVKKACQSRHLVVIRSATKFFGIPGLRLGYLAAHPETIKDLEKYQLPWSVNVLAGEAMAYAVKDKAFQKKSREFVKKEREWFSKEIESFGWFKAYPSSANFILCEIKKDPVLLDCYQIFDSLGKQGIFIRPGFNFTGLGSQFFRVAVLTRSENKRFLAAF